MKTQKDTASSSPKAKVIQTVKDSSSRKGKFMLGHKKTVKKLAFTIVDGLMEVVEKELKKKVECGVHINLKPTKDTSIFPGTLFEMTFCVHKDYGHNQSRLDIIYTP